MAELEMNDDGIPVLDSEKCSSFLHDMEELLQLDSDLHHSILSTASDCQQLELDQAFLEDLLMDGEAKPDNDHTDNAFLVDLNKEKEPSKNLLSERRRRQKINQRLYSLRAIVPNITKMDKASIIGDAISYVKDLQNQIQALKADIASPELTTATTSAHAQHHQHEHHQHEDEHEHGHKILELKISELEGKSETYEVRIKCKKESGVLIKVICALESESHSFDIFNAYINSLNNHRFLLSLLLKVNNPNLLQTKQLREVILDVLPKFGLRL